jgi:hypothetical protein
MDYAENAKERKENHWRAKVEAAEVRYSENPAPKPEQLIEALSKLSLILC